MVVTAAILTLLVSHGVNARPTFQSSPLLPATNTPPVASIDSTLTPEPRVTPGPWLTPEPTMGLPPTSIAPQPIVTAEPFPSFEPPSAVPMPMDLLPTPTVSGFLPAPTIVNPHDLGSLTLAQPMITDRGGAPVPTPTVIADADNGLRTELVLLNLIWLTCGIALLIGGAVTVFLLLRRSGRL